MINRSFDPQTPMRFGTFKMRRFAVGRGNDTLRMTEKRAFHLIAAAESGVADWEADLGIIMHHGMRSRALPEDAREAAELRDKITTAREAIEVLRRRRIDPNRKSAHDIRKKKATP